MARNLNEKLCITGSKANHHVNAIKQKWAPRPPTTPPVPKPPSRFVNSRPYIALPKGDKKKVMQKIYFFYFFKRKILQLLAPPTDKYGFPTHPNIDHKSSRENINLK